MIKRERIFLLLALLAVTVVTHVYAGEVKLTTYYPAPYGEYKKVVTKTLGVGDNDADGTIDAGDAPDPATAAGDVWVKGKVGIGTMAPNSSLDVVGNVRVSGVGADLWLIGGGDIALESGQQIGYDPDGTTAAGMQVASNQAQMITANTARLTVDSSGNVGIGTTAPSAKLEVAGNVKIGAYTLPNSDGTSGQTLMTNGSGVVSWQNAAGGRITTGSYVGSGSGTKIITGIPFQPRVVQIYGAYEYVKMDSMSGSSVYMETQGVTNPPTAGVSLLSNGFLVSGAPNLSGRTYYYLAEE